MRVDSGTPEAEGIEAVLLNGERIADEEAGWVTSGKDTRGVRGDNPTVTLYGDVKIVRRR